MINTASSESDWSRIVFALGSSSVCWQLVELSDASILRCLFRLAFESSLDTSLSGLLSDYHHFPRRCLTFPKLNLGSWAHDLPRSSSQFAKVPQHSELDKLLFMSPITTYPPDAQGVSQGQPRQPSSPT